MTKYPYELIPPASKQVYRPILPMKLAYPQTQKCTPPIRALIDSGADAVKEAALKAYHSFTPP